MEVPGFTVGLELFELNPAGIEVHEYESPVTEDAPMLVAVPAHIVRLPLFFALGIGFILNEVLSNEFPHAFVAEALIV